MKTLIYLLLFAVCVFCSCEKESQPALNSYIDNPESEQPLSWETGFIQGYLDADTICGWQEHDTDNMSVLFPKMHFWLEGTTYFDNPHWVTEGSRLYQKYAEQLGDTAFPRTIIRGRDRREIMAINKILGIEVICNVDFDNDHKAGSSVSDLLTFRGNSPVNYIKNGYKFFGEIETTPQTFSEHHWSAYEEIAVNAAKISDKDVQFYEYYFDLSFDQLPEKPGTYTFDVIVKFTEKELKTTVTMKF